MRLRLGYLAHRREQAAPATDHDADGILDLDVRRGGPAVSDAV